MPRLKKSKLDNDAKACVELASNEALTDEEDESYASRVRRCLAKKNSRYPPGMIPILDYDDDKKGENSSSDLSIASLTDSDNEASSGSRRNQQKHKNGTKRRPCGDLPIQESSSSRIPIGDSLDVNEFWSSPKKTAETIRTLPADYITLDDSFTSTPRLAAGATLLVEEQILEDTSDEEVQNEITIKVRFQGTIHRINLRKTDFFKVFFEKISKLGGVPVSDISILHKEKPVDLFDTLSSLPLSISDILEAYVLQTGNDAGSALPDENTISLKVQTKDRKDVTTIAIRKSDTMQVLMEKYSSLKGLHGSRLKFLFDGEVLDPEETAESLDLEGDECIDVFHV